MTRDARSPAAAPDPEARARDYERGLLQGLAGAAAVGFGLAMVLSDLAPAVALLASGLALANSSGVAARLPRPARLHVAIGFLVGSVLSVPPLGPIATAAVPVWLLVGAGAARAVTGRAGGLAWLVAAEIGAAWRLAGGGLDELPWLLFVLAGIATGYHLAAVFVSSREAALDQMSVYLAEKDLAEKRATGARLETEELLARVTHDLRTPLAGIVGVSELVKRERLSPSVAERLELIRGSAGTMLYVVHDLLDRSASLKSRLEAREVRFDLRAAIEECVGLSVPLARQKGLVVTLEPLPALPSRLVGDPVRLRQVLMNLLGNAVKFTRRGRVSLSVVELAAIPERRTYRFAVADTGPGLPAPLDELLGGSWDGVAPGAGAERGHGLGLRICQRLLEAMGGELGARSEPGAGATLWFDLALPVGAFVSEPGLEVPDFDEPADRRPRCSRALVVEDDPILAHVLSEFLGLLGVPADSASLAEEAAAAFAGRAFDLVLIDLRLPDRLGSELALDLRHRALVSGRLVLLGMSADLRLANPDSVEARAFDGVLIKPIGLDSLREALSTYFSLPAAPAAPASASAPSAVDRRRIEEILALERQTGRPLLGFLVESFSELGPGLVDEIRRALRDGDRSVARDAAHKLRGSSGNLGANEVMNAAAAIEVGFESLDSSPTRDDVDRLSDLVTRSIAELRTMV